MHKEIQSIIVEQKISTISEEERNIIRVLLYFDIFNYPLSTEEILRFMPMVSVRLTSSIEELKARGYIHRLNGFYSVQNDQTLATRREKGNLLAAKKILTAEKFSKFISSFPFVRAIMLSGSISKEYMDEKSDIDYFIITSPGRLWFVRSLLALFRRVFLFNSHKNLCTNYFIDTNQLEIDEKNIYSAIEIATLKPMYGEKWIREFYLANHWVHDFLPNYKSNLISRQDGNIIFKKQVETLLSTALFDTLEKKMRFLTLKRWKNKYKNEMAQQDFEIAFRSTTSVSRSHPQFFQKKVLNLYHQKIKSFEHQNSIIL